MSVPYYHLVGHLVAAAHAAHHESAAVSALKKAGIDAASLKKAEQLAHTAEELVADLMRTEGEDRIVEHEIHVAAGEIEMWMQTVEFLLSKTLDDGAVKVAMGSSMHGETHLSTVIGQALHLIAMMRTDRDVIDALGGERKVRDSATRAWALLKRLYRSTENRLDGAGDALAKHHDAMQSWVAALDASARKFSEAELAHLGRIGYVPHGMGVPVGGTAYGVVLHESGQGQVPDQADKKPCSGWSIGRQGNRENLGKGWA